MILPLRSLFVDYKVIICKITRRRQGHHITSHNIAFTMQASKLSLGSLRGISGKRRTTTHLVSGRCELTNVIRKNVYNQGRAQTSNDPA